jgi:hypothetical protein
MDDIKGARQVKLRVESFDDRLGWYSSGSLTLTLEQLPLLEQAIAEMRTYARACNDQPCEIILFPAPIEADADRRAAE